MNGYWVVGVRFRPAGKLTYYHPEAFALDNHPYVIAETARGLEYGCVVIGPREVKETDIVLPLRRIIKIADERDEEIFLSNKVLAQIAFSKCMERIVYRHLQMKLINAEYTFDRNKVIFYFTAEGRIDFRELVKDLASTLRTRIELRQIGVRDEAKLLGGIGPCGRVICCSSWLGDFVPVSIKMAKDQNLSLNPVKISGLCGRLMCCLKYEHDNYESVRLELPAVGAEVITSKGTGIVVSISPHPRAVRVRMHDISEEVDFPPEDVSEVEMA
jgi:cell fate regulator YaaT (PSP1 superfamily)